MSPYVSKSPSDGVSQRRIYLRQEQICKLGCDGCRVPVQPHDVTSVQKRAPKWMCGERLEAPETLPLAGSGKFRDKRRDGQRPWRSGVATSTHFLTTPLPWTESPPPAAASSSTPTLAPSVQRWKVVQLASCDSFHCFHKSYTTNALTRSKCTCHNYSSLIRPV